jgi:hypothetical protein
VPPSPGIGLAPVTKFNDIVAAGADSQPASSVGGSN